MNRSQMENDLNFNESSFFDRRIHFYTVLMGLYFLLAPFEDILRWGGIGTFAKYIALVIIMVMAITLAISGTSIRIQSGYVFWTPIILIALCWISMLWTALPDVSMSRNVTYTYLPLFFVIVYIMPFNKREYKFLANAAILGGVAVFIYLWYSGMITESADRLALTEENDPNNFSALLFLPFALCFGRIFERNGFFMKSLYILFCASIMYIMFMTASRGGLLSVIVFLIGFMVMLFVTGRKRAFYFLLVSAVIMFIFALLVLPDTLFERLFTLESYTEAAEEEGNRLQIWKNTFRSVFPVMPIYGYGSGTTMYVLGSFIYGYTKGMHNTYLNMIVEFGIIGLPIFIVFLSTLAKKLLKNRAIVEFAMLLGILCTIFFLDSYSKKFFWNVIIMIGIYLKSEKENRY